MKAAVRTVAKAQTETQTTKPAPGLALNFEFKRRVEAKAAETRAPANSIKEALARWLEEEL